MTTNQRTSENLILDLLGAPGAPAPTGAADSAQMSLAPVVLIVEDDPDIACSLTIRLKMAGYRTCLAGDAINAVAIALEQEPACAILDVNMPGGDGFGVAKQLRSQLQNPDIPIIFLTASMRSNLQEKADAAGGAIIITKPYNASELMATVQRLVDDGQDPAE